MSRVRRSVLFSALDRYATQMLLIGITAVMARVLTPEETGLYLVAFAFILLADNFRAFGTGVYILQAQELRREDVRSAFTLTLLVSLGLGAAIFSGGDFIAAVYGEPGLAPLLRLAAIGFLAVPFSGPILALLQRELAFDRVAVVNLSGAVVGSALTIVLGIAGFGAASYLWGFVAQAFVVALICLALRPAFWIFRPCFSGMQRVVSFGTISSAVTLLNMVSDLLPRLAFGKLLGMDAVGLYGRAVTICQLPDRAVVSALQPVVLPAMTDRVRAGGDLKTVYLRGHALMSGVQWPALVMLAIMAEPVVRVLLGPQWGETVPLVRIIALANMALAPAFMTFPVLVASGRIRDTLISTLISLPPSMLIVIHAATISLEAVAASLFLTAPLQMFVALAFVRRAIGLDWGELLAASRASLGVTFGTALIPTSMVFAWGGALPWYASILALSGAALGWVAALILTRHPIRNEITQLARIMRARVATRKQATLEAG